MPSAGTQGSDQDAASFADFGRRIAAYVELRNQLSEGIPAPSDSATPEEIVESERALASRVRSARATAKHGDVFNSSTQETLRRALASELQGRRGLTTRGIIMDENPGRLPFRVNQPYPKDRPLSTIPPNVLRRLPALPLDLEYRFIGPHLILRDARTNLIVDYVPNAIPP
jgi:hypothetical protein